MHRQLSLPVHLPDDETFDSYYGADSQRQIIHTLKNIPNSDTHAPIFIWGLHGAGRTHLLHATCAHAQQQGLASIYLPLSIHSSLSYQVLENLEQTNLICLDDIHHVAANPVWEEAIFDLYNRALEGNGTQLIFTANRPIASIDFLLPDLRSRLQWGLTFKLEELADDDKIAVLCKRAENRGLELPEEVARFLLNRLNRDLRTLLDVMDKLDKASMVHQRKLTIPFVKSCLHI